MDGGEFGQALYMTEMMVTSIKEEGNDWAKFRIPVCGLLFGTFQLRADEYDTVVVKADAEEEIKTLQQSPCVKVSDKEFRCFFREVLSGEIHCIKVTLRSPWLSIFLGLVRKCFYSTHFRSQVLSFQ